jgi:hypothetical protein
MDNMSEEQQVKEAEKKGGGAIAQILAATEKHSPI